MVSSVRQARTVSSIVRPVCRADRASSKTDEASTRTSVESATTATRRPIDGWRNCTNRVIVRYSIMRRSFWIISIASIAAAAAALAQETPTEREAAREVLRKMAVLEKSLDVPATVALLTVPNPQRDLVVGRARELMQNDLLALADDITKHPEIGFEEKRSIETLAEYLRKHDFDVKIGVAGLNTALIPRWKRSNGAPNLCLIVEDDALLDTQRPVHADQHSS